MKPRERVADAPISPQQQDAIRFELMGRLRMHATLVERAMLREFHHTPEAVERWQAHIEHLDDASLPLYLHNERANNAIQAPILYFCKRLLAALDSLFLEDKKPVDAIYDALAQVTRARHGLLFGQREMMPTLNTSVPYLLPQSDSQDELNSWGRLVNSSNAFRASYAPGERNEVKVVHASTDVCLNASYVSAMHPQLYDSVVAKEIAWMHQVAAGRMSVDFPREHVYKNLGVLSALEPTRFRKSALSIPSKNPYNLPH